MSDMLEPLLLDLLESVARRPRPYGEVVDAWRTSCPRLPVWETAWERKLLCCQDLVRPTSEGLSLLRKHGRLEAKAEPAAGRAGKAQRGEDQVPVFR